MREDVPEPVVLGWRERVALPGFGIGSLRAKIDTGARTSALHVDQQWRFAEGGAPWVGFRLTRSRSGRVCEVVTPVHDERVVADSGGHRGLRVFVRTRLRLAGVEREVEINLAQRSGMSFPMLVGRSALQGAFTVDPAGSFLHRRVPR